METLSKTLSECLRGLIRFVKQASHKNGQSIIGLIGWFGVWLHRSLSVVFQKDVPLKTLFLVDTHGGLLGHLRRLSSLDITGIISNNADYAAAILKIFDTMPLANIGLLLLAVTMIAFYATTFDALTLVVSAYSYKELEHTHGSDKRVRMFWSLVFILFPIALIFSENSMYNLQSVAIIAALPIGIIIVMIIASFFKDAKDYLKN